MFFIVQHLGSSPQSSLAMTGPVQQQFFLSAKSVFLQRVLVVSSVHLLPLFPLTSELLEIEIQSSYRMPQLRVHDNEKHKSPLSFPLAYHYFGNSTVLNTPCDAQNAAHHCNSIFFLSWFIFLVLLLSWIQLR